MTPERAAAEAEVERAHAALKRAEDVWLSACLALEQVRDAEGDSFWSKVVAWVRGGK